MFVLNSLDTPTITIYETSASCAGCFCAAFLCFLPKRKSQSLLFLQDGNPLYGKRNANNLTSCTRITRCF